MGEVKWSPDGRFLSLSTRARPGLHFITADGHVSSVRCPGNGTRTRSLAWASASLAAASIGPSGPVCVFDAADGSERTSLRCTVPAGEPSIDPPHALACAAGGAVVLGAGAGGLLSVWDTEAGGAPTTLVRLRPRTHWLCIDAEPGGGSCVAVGSAAGDVAVIDLRAPASRASASGPYFGAERVSAPKYGLERPRYIKQSQPELRGKGRHDCPAEARLARLRSLDTVLSVEHGAAAVAAGAVARSGNRGARVDVHASGPAFIHGSEKGSRGVTSVRYAPSGLHIYVAARRAPRGNAAVKVYDLRSARGAPAGKPVPLTDAATARGAIFDVVDGQDTLAAIPHDPASLHRGEDTAGAQGSPGPDQTAHVLRQTTHGPRFDAEVAEVAAPTTWEARAAIPVDPADPANFADPARNAAALGDLVVAVRGAYKRRWKDRRGASSVVAHWQDLGAGRDAGDAWHSVDVVAAPLEGDIDRVPSSVAVRPGSRIAAVAWEKNSVSYPTEEVVSFHTIPVPLAR